MKLQSFPKSLKLSFIILTILQFLWLLYSIIIILSFLGSLKDISSATDFIEFCSITISPLMFLVIYYFLIRELKKGKQSAFYFFEISGFVNLILILSSSLLFSTSIFLFWVPQIIAAILVFFNRTFFFEKTTKLKLLIWSLSSIVFVTFQLLWILNFGEFLFMGPA